MKFAHAALALTLLAGSLSAREPGVWLLDEDPIPALVVVAVEGSARLSVDGAERPLVPGDEVFPGQVILADAGGSVDLDGPAAHSRLRLLPGSRLRIDELASITPGWDPAFRLRAEVLAGRIRFEANPEEVRWEVQLLTPEGLVQDVFERESTQSQGPWAD